MTNAPKADFGGYTNRHLNSEQVAESIEKTKVASAAEEMERTYTMEFMMSLRGENKTRPVNMTLLDFPHKKRKGEFRRNEEVSEIDRFNKSVRQIRILLNKLSDSNFAVIEGQLLRDFEYTPSLLYELMKQVFMKATTEQSFMELYVRLCVTLFKKFNDKENAEMNFRKLLLTRCEKQFYRMLKVEQEDRRVRRASMEEALLKEEKSERNADYNKQMLAIFDESEIKERQKLQMFGNMYLIVELFKYNQIKSNIIVTCISEMFEEVNTRNVEILCQMLAKLARHEVKASRDARKEKEGHKDGVEIKRKAQHVDMHWLDDRLQALFSERQNNTGLESRVRFQIQDLIDEYEKDWKYEILASRQRGDSDGFQKKYVPKSQLMNQDPKKGRGRKNSRASSSSKERQPETGYMYVKKAPKQDEAKKGAPSMFSLLSGLKPDDQAKAQDSRSEDEDANKIVDRKISINQSNVTGLDFEKYNDLKPTPEIKRKITNLCLEFRESGDKEHASAEFIEICEQTGLKRFVFLGYLLNNALSMDQNGWDETISLVIDTFFKAQNLFAGKDIVEA